MEAWYALHTKPRAESRVDHALATRGFNTYLPMLPLAKGGRAEPLFPTYLFICCDLETIDIAQLQWVPGLSHILAFGGKAAVVPEDAILLIRTRLAEAIARGAAQGELSLHEFQPGEEVVIEAGPLAGMRGIFQGPAGAAERVQILIRFLGEANRAEVPAAALRSVADEGKKAGSGKPAEITGETRPRGRGTRGGGRQIRHSDH
jgi:transcriptional antiterminator RfaH